MGWAENTDKLPTEQSEFRKHHSTNDKLFELTQAVCQAHRLSMRVGAIFVDMKRHSTESGTMAYVTNVTHERTRFASQMDFQQSKDRTVKVIILGHNQGNCDQLWCSPRRPYQPSSLPSLLV